MPNAVSKLQEAVNKNGLLGVLPVIKESFKEIGEVHQLVLDQPQENGEDDKIERSFAVAGIDCKSSTYGCCNDGNTPASGANGKGCPEGKYDVITTVYVYLYLHLLRKQFFYVKSFT